MRASPPASPDRTTGSSKPSSSTSTTTAMRAKPVIRRRSGLLTPYYSQTSTRGLEFGIPYYWNIAPERDATLTPVFMARRGFQLKSDFRYMQPQHAGQLRYEYLPDDPVYGRTRTGLAWLHTQNFSPTFMG